MAANNRLDHPVINLTDIQPKISYASKEDILGQSDDKYIYIFNYDVYQTHVPSDSFDEHMLTICTTNKWMKVLTMLLLQQDLIFSPIIYKVPKDSKLINQVLDVENRTAIYIIDHGIYDIDLYDYQYAFQLLNYKIYNHNAPPNTSSNTLYNNYPDTQSDVKTVTLEESLEYLLNRYASNVCNDEFKPTRKILFIVYDMWQSVCSKLYFASNNKDLTSNYVYDKTNKYTNMETLSMGPKKLKDILHSLVDRGYEVLPNIDFMHDVGTKEYARHMKQFMFPETYIFPDEVDLIKQLPPDKLYAVKSGMTSSKKGVIIAIGHKIMSAIRDMSCADMRDQTLITDAEIDQYNKSINDCTSRIFIIQPNNDIYKRCHEYRFMVLRDKIIGLADPRSGRSNLYPDVKSGHKLNQDIYNFIHKIIKHVSSRYVNYIYMRVDIIMECDNNTHDLPKDIDIIFSPQLLEGKIWLNEIEPLGSGHKGRYPTTLYDTGVDAKLIAFQPDSYLRNTVGNSIVNNICYQTHRILSGLDNSDISITLLNLNWFDQLSTDGGQFTDDNNVRNINLECHGQWTWKYVEQLMINQLRPSLGSIKTIEFYKINDHTREIINHTDTILNTLLPPTDTIYGFSYNQ